MNQSTNIQPVNPWTPFYFPQNWLTLLAIIGVLGALSLLIRTHQALIAAPAEAFLPNYQSFAQPIALTDNEGLITLTWVYADQNQIAIGYQIQAAHATLTNIALQTKSGLLLPLTINHVGGKNEDSTLFFDASPLAQATNEIALHLDLGLETGATPVAVGFDFAVSVIAGQVIEVGQTSRDQQITITLKKVILSPTETTAILCFSSPDTAYDMWLPTSAIQVGAKEATVGSQSQPDAIGCTINRYFPTMYGASGAGQLNVTELIGFKPNGKLMEQKRLAGNWNFQFVIP